MALGIEAKDPPIRGESYDRVSSRERDSRESHPLLGAPLRLAVPIERSQPVVSGRDDPPRTGDCQGANGRGCLGEPDLASSRAVLHDAARPPDERVPMSVQSDVVGRIAREAERRLPLLPGCQATRSRGSRDRESEES